MSSARIEDRPGDIANVFGGDHRAGLLQEWQRSTDDNAEPLFHPERRTGLEATAGRHHLLVFANHGLAALRSRCCSGCGRGLPSSSSTIARWKHLPLSNDSVVASAAAALLPATC